jgi:hypothetical protein
VLIPNILLERMISLQRWIVFMILDVASVGDGSAGAPLPQETQNPEKAEPGEKAEFGRAGGRQEEGEE